MAEQKLKGRVTGIYGITYKSKIYIGSAIHIRNRWNGHKSDLKAGIHSCQAMQRIFDKFNKERIERNEEPSFDCFDFFVIKSLDQKFVNYHYDRLKEEYGSRKVGKVFSNLVLVPIEQVYMNMNPKNRLNSLPAAGSNKGNKPSPKTRRKLSEAGKGRKHSPSTRQKQSEARLGYVMPEHSRKKLSDAKKGTKRDPDSVERGAEKLRKPFTIYKAKVGYINGYGLKTYAKSENISYTGLRDVINGKYPMSNMHFKDEESFLKWKGEKEKITSTHKGVYFHSGSNRWMARVRIPGEYKYVGRSQIESEATELSLIAHQVYGVDWTRIK
jgi:hypothetical protein